MFPEAPVARPTAPALLSFALIARCGSWPAARMQQNGSSGSNSSDGSGRERLALSFSPLPAATTRVRRFIQERRSLPLPRVMVVFSATDDTEKPNDADAMSSADRAEEERRKPASPPAGSAVSKPLRPSLDVQEQEVLFTHHTQASKQEDICLCGIFVYIDMKIQYKVNFILDILRHILLKRHIFSC